MKELLKQAAEFLKEHQEINEVEIADVRGRVHLVRIAPASQQTWYWPQSTWTTVVTNMK